MRPFAEGESRASVRLLRRLFEYGEGAIKLKISAPPVDGKANAEVEAFFARLLGARKSDVEVVKGASSRDKAVFVRGSTPADVEKVLAKHL